MERLPVLAAIPTPTPIPIVPEETGKRRLLLLREVEVDGPTSIGLPSKQGGTAEQIITTILIMVLLTSNNHLPIETTTIATIATSTSGPYSLEIPSSNSLVFSMITPIRSSKLHARSRSTSTRQPVPRVCAGREIRTVPTLSASCTSCPRMPVAVRKHRFPIPISSGSSFALEASTCTCRTISKNTSERNPSPMKTSERLPGISWISWPVSRCRARPKDH
mmetsp:Transcript_23424/g.55187  ORF Transcript_23424/g.55187 Transcript_23424/m.55187 type:complete len:220 (+) Transcript_23424:537-1196(+)